MLAEADVGRRLCADDLAEQGLAVDQRRLGEVEAFAVEQIEPVEAEAVLPAGAEISLQMIEARQAGGVLDDDLAVNIGRAQPEAGERGGDAAETVGPIEAGAGEELDLAAVDAGLDAIAVLLDLVHPFVAARRALAG